MSPTKDPKLVSLIQVVRDHKELYDYRLEKYKDEEHKSKIWAAVAVECGYDNAEEAECTWNDLYNTFMLCYRNEIIRLARSNFDENEVELPQERKLNKKGAYNYYSEMRFIAPFRNREDIELERLIKLVKPIVMRTSHAQKTNGTMVISTVSTSAETQTPPESIFMDIPPIVEENLTDKELCLRSFFDAMYLATINLPTRLQNKVKLEMLQSISDAEIAAIAHKDLKNTYS